MTSSASSPQPSRQSGRQASRPGAAGVTGRVHVRTRALDASSSLLDAVPRAEDALAWVREGEGMVGWGVAARFE
ncbi:MAG TPA: hypothetical protein VF444_17845, partial [Pseudonocardiaceae bacterium]